MSSAWAPATRTAVAAAGPSPIRLRGAANLCLDTAGATDQAPIHAYACNASRPTQMFSLQSQSALFHIMLGASSTCLENFFGGPITVWGNCPWSGGDSSGKAWSYDNTTGHLKNGGCLTASGSNVAISACSPGTNPSQSWDVVGAPMPTPPPPPPPRSEGHTIGLRGDKTLCMDSQTASNTEPVKMAACVANKTSQLFTLATQGDLFHIALWAKPDVCLEDWFPGTTDSPVTVWPDCPWQPGRSATGKAWSYDNATGLLNNTNADWGQHGCLAAHGANQALTVRKCDASDPNQAWLLEGAP